MKHNPFAFFDDVTSSPKVSAVIVLCPHSPPGRPNLAREQSRLNRALASAADKVANLSGRSPFCREPSDEKFH